ncbi:unnamed protein product [Brassicogethes aeneus]|uniref:Sodium/potassium-transporting ATPase subunit alpha n=1 Tax=Brassicogethes aeneus TaxID=1431903 RepID=A0A9P0FR98_BRAAE|nr:unnamed protein product [Brassicogethes aeneus]
MRENSTVSIKSKSSTGAVYMKPVKKVRSKGEIEEFKKEIAMDDHMLPLDVLVQRYNTDTMYGLPKSLAQELLIINGPNCLVASAGKSKYAIFFGHIFGGFNVLLWIGGIMTLVGYFIGYATDKDEAEIENIYLAVILIAVALFTGIFGFYQESTNIDIMKGFAKMVPKYATVIRGGEKMVIPSEELVIGDLIEIKFGDMVPADMRIIYSQNLKIDNSPITGESLAVNRSPECTHNNPLETMNLAFYTTLVVEGTGTGIVIKTGDNTVIGRIAGLTSSLQKDASLISKEIRKFVWIISSLAFIIAGTFFIASMLIGYNFFKSFAFFIAILVANVPEGLPVTLTACLTLTAKRMAKKNCLVKKLECIETLGSCNVICSDKTGTLTQNKMTAGHMYYDNQEVNILTDFTNVNKNSAACKALCNVGMLCSMATFYYTDMHLPPDERRTYGDASESAILKMMEKLWGDVDAKRENFPKFCEIPFNSSNKYQVSIHKVSDTDTFLLVMKGASEQVLERCTTMLYMDEEVEINIQMTVMIKKALMRLSHMGERVLAFADLQLDPEVYGDEYKFNSEVPNFPLSELRFVGFISLIDPPRPSVPEAVAKCRQAGIKVIMVTGDHPITAAAIAKKVGIISPTNTTIYDIAMGRDMSVSAIKRDGVRSDSAVITGAELREMDDFELEFYLREYQEIVFARTSPQQKLKIVEAFQKLNLTVAVTGDGVNDSPALKKANIGIAMGITGSDVSKEAADMILLDDNFSSIVTGIEEGRLIFDNLKKSVAFVLTSNVPEIVPFVLLVTLNIPTPLSIMAVLVIDVGTDLFPAISLAYEKAEADIMIKPPRDPNRDSLINCKLIYYAYFQIGLIQAIASMTCYFILLAGHGFFIHTNLIGRFVYKNGGWKFVAVECLFCLLKVVRQKLPITITLQAVEALASCYSTYT